MRIKPLYGVLTLVGAVLIGYLFGVACERDPVSIGVEGAATVKVYEIPAGNFQGSEYVEFDELRLDPVDDDTTPMLLIYGDHGSDGVLWYPLDQEYWHAKDGNLHIDDDGQGTETYRIVLMYQLD
ncbi:MAG: hypothetical protein GF403_08190 [Candidatus Coatesbacteria bacterium]|jgi:hypothetical protein|nr:hypothetical protein [Candidatus Coatesbacteria bacterium]